MHSNENSSTIVDSLPTKSLQQQHYKEEGDVLSSQQPTFAACSSIVVTGASRGNGMRVTNTISSESISSSNDQCRDSVKDDNNSNLKAAESDLTSLSSLHGKAASSDLSAHYSSCNLRHNLSSNDQGITIYEKGKRKMFIIPIFIKVAFNFYSKIM